MRKGNSGIEVMVTRVLRIAKSLRSSRFSQGVADLHRTLKESGDDCGENTARRALQLLVKLGAVRRQRGGRYEWIHGNLAFDTWRDLTMEER